MFMSDRYRTICRLVACSLTLFLAACTVPVRDQSPPAIPETEAAQAIVAAAPAAPASEPANDTVGANTDDTAAATAITKITIICPAWAEAAWPLAPTIGEGR